MHLLPWFVPFTGNAAGAYHLCHHPGRMQDVVCMDGGVHHAGHCVAALSCTQAQRQEGNHCLDGRTAVGCMDRGGTAKSLQDDVCTHSAIVWGVQPWCSACHMHGLHGWGTAMRSTSIAQKKAHTT